MKFEIERVYSETLKKVIYWTKVDGSSKEFFDTVGEAEEFLDSYVQPEPAVKWEYVPKAALSESYNNIDAMCLTARLKVAGVANGN